MYELVLSFSTVGEGLVAEQTFTVADVADVADLAQRNSAQFDLGDFDGANVYTDGDVLTDQREPLMTADEVEAWVGEYLAVPA